jgi:hypothetical protein
MGLRVANNREVEAGTASVLYARECYTERYGPAGLELRQDSRQEERRTDVVVLRRVRTPDQARGSSVFRYGKKGRRS